MRKLVYYVACSVDKFIAQKDGSAEGFLYEGAHMQDLMQEFPETFPSHLRGALGISGSNRHFDTVLMGRKTYEVGLPLGVTSPYSTMRQVVVSSTLQESPDKDVELVREGVLEVVRTLKQEEGKDIWLCGGGELASALSPEIDSLILKVNPFLMGEGIPLFAGSVAQTELSLADSKLYPNGFVRLHYDLKHGTP